MKLLLYSSPSYETTEGKNLQFQEDVTVLVEKNEDYHQTVCHCSNTRHKNLDNHTNNLSSL